MNSQGFWRRRETRIAYMRFSFVLFDSDFRLGILGRAIVSFGKSSWPTEDVYRTAAMVRQAGILTGGISGLGLVLSLQAWRKKQDSLLMRLCP